MWLGGAYCLVIGASQILGIALAMRSAGDMIRWLLPNWAYAVSFGLPGLRVLVGILLLRRSKYSVAASTALVLVALAFPVYWQWLWRTQTGRPLAVGLSGVLLEVADLLVIVLIAWYARRLSKHGVLR